MLRTFRRRTKSHLQSLIPLEQLAFVVAFQRFVAALLDGPQNLTQFNGAAILDVHHGSCELRIRDSPEFARQIVTNPRLFPVAALAGDFDIFLANDVGTLAIVARCATLVPAIQTSAIATLLANIAVLQTRFFLVTDFKALVTPANETFAAGHAAREGFLVAGNRFTLLVLSITILCRLNHAGRALGGRVTVVQDGMRARMTSGAGFFARGLLRAARNGRVNDVGATLAK